jgi:glycosyltransferase involved in cell wall biosynthesis
MIVGGAQENTLLNCQDLINLYGDDVLLVTGPSLGPEGDLLAKGRGPEVPVARIPYLRRAIHPWRDLRSYWEIRRLLREFHPEVVHTHSAKGGILGRLAAHAMGVPAIIHTVHGAPFHEFQSRGARWFFRACEKYAAQRCHAIVSVADAMTDRLVKAGVAPHAKFSTVYSGMDVEPFLHADQHRAAARERLGYDQSHVVVGKIARLFHLKGHEYLIQAAAETVRQCPQVRFLLVGDGILRQKLARQIHQAGLADYFQFVGLVEPERIPELISAMDVLVHVSLREGLARALPQALIAGKPVVSYDVDGAREVVIPEETGFLVPPQEIEPLQRALITLANNPPLRESLGSRGRQQFTEAFRHERMTEQLRQIYQRLLRGAD